ncbi:hypothetical protein [Streptomyces sp. NPDC058398]|uniref:hypothetical protein n=1 Tax=Streptomyces sp. NPDC058398 TaxID=3346479 RepID=UPI0036637EE8
MMTLGLETGDAATWASSVVAVLAVAFAIWQQWKQGRGQAEADAIARRQLEATERRTLVLEESLGRLVEQLPAALQAQARIAATPDRHPEAIAWELERRSKNLFVLRNQGTETAEGVRVDLGEHPAGLTRRVPVDGVVRKRESVEFVIIGAWQHPVPREVKVWWDGAAEPAVLPVPHWD